MHIRACDFIADGFQEMHAEDPYEAMAEKMVYCIYNGSVKQRVEEAELVYEAAYKMKLDKVGNKVYFRGIVEFSNICVKNCDYCGIRKDNKTVERFSLEKEDIVKSAKWAYDNKYGSMVLQSEKDKMKSMLPL